MKIKGVVDSIIYHNSENGYSVIELNVAGNGITAVGSMPTITEGTTLELTGEMGFNNKYGEQFKIASARIVIPTDCESILRYLSSGLFKGVGEVTAFNIVDMFGEDTFKIIADEPAKLAKVAGVSYKKAMAIHETYTAYVEMQDTILYLQGLGISLNLALNIYKAYGKNTVNTVESNPYKLIEDIDGVGFYTADKIAESAGIDRDSLFRITAGIMYALKSAASNNGHTYLPKALLISEASKLLAIDPDSTLFEECISQAEIMGSIVVLPTEDGDAVMYGKYYNTEQSIAYKLIRLSNSALDIHSDVESDIAEFERYEGIKMHEGQVRAVMNAVKNGVNVITGGPGTGKTTIIKCIIGLFTKLNMKVQLCAPTGRAAKRLFSSTDVEAKTIHRLLDLDFKNGKGYFSFNADTQLDCDVVIVDEVSMCDEYVFEALLSAIRSGGRLIMVGDKDQLPSVGAGNLLADIISYGEIPVSYLTHIYRQSEESLIVTNAHRINHGEMPILRNTKSDFLFDNISDSEKIASRVVEMVTEKIPSFLGVPRDDIQVLCPMKKGVAGVNNLNLLLQEAINPRQDEKAELKYGEGVFREGDKVIHLINNYNMEWTREEESGAGVFNGDIGYIISADPIDNVLTVRFEDEREAKYHREDLEQLKLAYAISVHKSQGSEFPVAVIAISAGSYMLLTRNLLYTAVTRAKKMSVIVGSAQNLERMVKNNYTQRRYTMLVRFLTNEGKKFS